MSIKGASSSTDLTPTLRSTPEQCFRLQPSCFRSVEPPTRVDNLIINWRPRCGPRRWCSNRKGKCYAGPPGLSQLASGVADSIYNSDASCKKSSVAHRLLQMGSCRGCSTVAAKCSAFFFFGKNLLFSKLLVLLISVSISCVLMTSSGHST